MPLSATKILIYGVTGSGKTSFAAKLADATGIPWVEVDTLTWEPGWVEVPLDEQRRRVEAICQGEAWILDSAYSKWIDLVLPKVDLIVALDYPRWVSLGRLLKRTLGRAIDRRPVCNGNYESFRTMFSRDSILLWHFRSFHNKVARIDTWQRSGTPAVLRFKKPGEADRWLGSI